MAANVETMFYVRETPWHGMGIKVAKALTSNEALTMAGLDWNVEQRTLKTEDGIAIPNMLANIRDLDNSVLGVVSERYKVLQNNDAFKFTDELLGNGITYETAGSLQKGRKVWMLAKLSEEYTFLDDKIVPYLVLSNSHDGSAPVRVAMTPVRVVCQNTLNLSLRTAPRSWSIRHVGNIHNAISDARETLGLAKGYMKKLDKELLKFNHIKLNDSKLEKMINILIPLEKDASSIKSENVNKIRTDIYLRYKNAPDVINMDKTGYRFINAVSDHETHFKPFRTTDSYKENLFIKVIEKPKLLDRAVLLLNEAV